MIGTSFSNHQFTREHPKQLQTINNQLILNTDTTPPHLCPSLYFITLPSSTFQCFFHMSEANQNNNRPTSQPFCHYTSSSLLHFINQTANSHVKYIRTHFISTATSMRLSNLPPPSLYLVASSSV